MKSIIDLILQIILKLREEVLVIKVIDQFIQSDNLTYVIIFLNINTCTL